MDVFSVSMETNAIVFIDLLIGGSIWKNFLESNHLYISRINLGNI